MNRGVILLIVAILSGVAFARDESPCEFSLELVSHHPPARFSEAPVVMDTDPHGLYVISSRRGDGSVQVVRLAGKAPDVVSTIKGDAPLRIRDEEPEWEEIPRSPINAIAIAPANGKPGFVALANDSGLVEFHDASTGKMVVRSYQGNQPYVEGLLFSPDGKHLASVAGPEVNLLAAKTGEPEGVLVMAPQMPIAHPGKINGLKFYAEGDRLVTYGEDGARIWDTSQMRGPKDFRYQAPDREMKSQGSPFTAMDVFPGGRKKTQFAFGDEAGKLTIWGAGKRESSGSVKTGELTIGGKVPTTNPEITAVSFSPDGKSILATTLGGTAALWNVENRSVPVVIPGDPYGPINKAKLLSREYAVTAHADGQVVIWKLEAPTFGRAYAKAIAYSKDSKLSVDDLRILPGGRILTSSQDGTVRVGDVPKLTP